MDAIPVNTVMELYLLHRVTRRKHGVSNLPAGAGSFFGVKISENLRNLSAGICGRILVFFVTQSYTEETRSFTEFIGSKIFENLQNLSA
jgi:hypothetical protein